MLHQALVRLLAHTSFEKIAVCDVASEATVNRATFYAHYADKYVLLEDLVSVQFQDLLDRRGVVFNSGCLESLANIVLAVCTYLSELPGMTNPQSKQMDRHLELALRSVIHRAILGGLDKAAPRPPLPEVTAAMISGAIYGGAYEWVRMAERAPPEEIAKSISSLVLPMLHRNS